MKRNNSLYTFIFCSILLCVAACTTNSRQYDAGKPALDATAAKTAVQEVLDEQTVCWGNGDLECYMAGYWKSDSLVFVGKSGLTYGWQQTLDNYKRNYPDTNAMGKLSFDILKMDPLSDETMLVIGKWHLKREIAAGDLQGHFSVVFKRFPDGWKIIADHSS